MFVYFVQAMVGGPVKIGLAGDVKKRMRHLQIANPFPLVVLATVPGDRPLEKSLHDEFDDHHVHGEWFHANESLHAAMQREVDARTGKANRKMVLSKIGSPKELEKQSRMMVWQNYQDQFDRWRDFQEFQYATMKPGTLPEPLSPDWWVPSVTPRVRAFRQLGRVGIALANARTKHCPRCGALLHSGAEYANHWNLCVRPVAISFRP